jgi:hypothetical protein
VTDDKIVAFRSAAPSMRLKSLDWTDKRSQCKHFAVQVWSNEPILECCDCGAVVDPYQWIRARIAAWSNMEIDASFRVKEARAELEELKKTLRVLRAEYKDEKERREAETALMVLPRRRV